MALINLRNALMAGRRLPYDAEVEYLATTGGQYINTGIIGSSATKVEIAAYTTNITTTMALFGARNTSNGNRPSYSIWRSAVQVGGQRMRFDYNSASADSVVGGDWDASMVNTITKDNVSNYINGTLASTNTARSFSLDIPFYLGTINGSGTPATYYFVGRIYSCKLWDANGVLVFDGIPVRKGTVGYLYDRVSGKLFGNAGTGDFALGPDVVPVEYIESHGTEYIDTGMVATNSHGFRIDIATAQKEKTVNTRIFGTHEGNTRFGFSLYGTEETGGNTAFWGWNAATAISATIPQRFVASLNYQNDRKAIFNGTTYISSLGTLGSLTQSIYLLNANYGGAPFANQYVVGKLYGAEITVGSDVANHYIPVRVGTEGAMMDVLTRRIYRNAGTGAFTYGNDLKYPIPAE